MSWEYSSIIYTEDSIVKEYIKVEHNAPIVSKLIFMARQR